MLALKQPPKQAHDRRRHRRVAISLVGRYMLENRQEYSCQTIDMSPGGLLIKAPVLGHIGERVIVYLEQLGRIEGKISRVTSNGFALSIVTTMRKRDKFASQLTWLANRAILGLPEDRRHARLTPRNPLAVLTMANGLVTNIRLIDVSLSGAAFTCDARLEKGAVVTIGATQARVVRATDSGIAVEFVTPLTEEMFNENLVL